MRCSILECVIRPVNVPFSDLLMLAQLVIVTNVTFNTGRCSGMSPFIRHVWWSGDRSFEESIPTPHRRPDDRLTKRFSDSVLFTSLSLCTCRSGGLQCVWDRRCQPFANSDGTGARSVLVSQIILVASPIMTFAYLIIIYWRAFIDVVSIHFWYFFAIVHCINPQSVRWMRGGGNRWLADRYICVCMYGVWAKV